MIAAKHPCQGEFDAFLEDFGVERRSKTPILLRDILKRESSGAKGGWARVDWILAHECYAPAAFGVLRDKLRSCMDDGGVTVLALSLDQDTLKKILQAFNAAGLR